MSYRPNVLTSRYPDFLSLNHLSQMSQAQEKNKKSLVLHDILLNHDPPMVWWSSKQRKLEAILQMYIVAMMLSPSELWGLRFAYSKDWEYFHHYYPCLLLFTSKNRASSQPSTICYRQAATCWHLIHVIVFWGYNILFNINLISKWQSFLVWMITWT